MSVCFKCYCIIFGYTFALLILQLRTKDLKNKKKSFEIFHSSIYLMYFKRLSEYIPQAIHDFFSIRTCCNINRCSEIMPVFNSPIILHFVSVGMCTSLDVPLLLFVSRFFSILSNQVPSTNGDRLFRMYTL